MQHITLKQRALSMKHYMFLDTLSYCAGEDHAQDQSEVLAALEEALADDIPSQKLIVAADPGATGSSTKSSSTGSANISVIATADMIVRRPRNRWA